MSLNQKLSKLRADGYITDDEYQMLKQEPKTGHWEYGYAFPDGNYCKCSECKEIIKCIYPMHYCPNCGARMAESEG